jgi:hypothetical protein
VELLQAEEPSVRLAYHLQELTIDAISETGAVCYLELIVAMKPTLVQP